MNLPNRITFSRIILSAIFLIFFNIENYISLLIAFFIFIIAIFTDLYDGYIARKTGIITGFGKFFDPLADKILITVVFLSLIEKNILPSWFVALVLIREFLITGLRTIAAYKGISIAASKIAKTKTFFQFTLCFIGIIKHINSFIKINFLDTIFSKTFIFYFTIIVIIFTYLSAYDYIVKSKKILEGDF